MAIGKLSPVLAIVTCLAIAACSSSSDSAPPAGSATIGAAGGTVAVTEGNLAGTEIEVPAGALSQDTAISIYEDSYSKEPGKLPLGPAARFEPTTLVYGSESTFTLIFDPSLTPTGTPDSAFQIGFRAANGVVTFLTPTAIDQTTGTAQFRAVEQGTFWVVIPDEFQIQDYLPLNSGDTYLFDNGLTISVAQTNNEPNFGLAPIIKMSLIRSGLTQGYYLDYDNGALQLYGRFWVQRAQEQLDAPVTLLDALALIPSRQDATYTYKGYMPFGSSFVRYTGIALTETRPEARTSVGVPAGSFDDCIELVFDTVYRDTQPLYGTTTTTWWLARGVGPVKIRTEDGRVFDLQSSNVLPDNSAAAQSPPNFWTD